MSTRSLNRQTLIVVACAALGAAALVIGLQGLALLAQAMDIAWLRDVAVNTGPLAVAGGAAAGGAAAGGRPALDPDGPYVPIPTKIFDPSTGKTRDPSWYDKLTWEINRRIEGLPTGEEIHNQIRSDYHDRQEKLMTEPIPDDPPPEPTTPYGDPLAEPPDQAGGFGSVQPVGSPTTTGTDSQDSGPPPPPPSGMGTG